MEASRNKQNRGIPSIIFMESSRSKQNGIPYEFYGIFQKQAKMGFHILWKLLETSNWDSSCISIHSQLKREREGKWIREEKLLETKQMAFFLPPFPFILSSKGKDSRKVDEGEREGSRNNKNVWVYVQKRFQKQTVRMCGCMWSKGSRNKQ